jgi:hypothetical protein
MVKSDEHMGRVKAKLVDTAAGKKAASEARRQRDLKKFGKQVQVAKLQERDKAKRETMDKINLLKRSTLHSFLTVDHTLIISVQNEHQLPQQERQNQISSTLNWTIPLRPSRATVTERGVRVVEAMGEGTGVGLTNVKRRTRNLGLVARRGLLKALMQLVALMRVAFLLGR